MKIGLIEGRKTFTTLTLTLFALVFAACAPPAPTNSGVSSNSNAAGANVNVNANTNAAPAVNPQAALSMPVTLPVLDAMFSDEQFASELKTKLQLTDQQIDQIKQVSTEAVQNLDETGAGDYSGSTRAATERAAGEIRRIVGEDKAPQFFEFVRQRWEGGAIDASGATTAGAQPNAVPSDTRIVVNAPAYRMDIFQDGKLVKTYKIGIGYPEFPLPSGQRKAETIIFNPTWTPPDEPWVKGKVQPGKTVEAGSKLNPLGPVKIPIGLPSLIHGGKQQARLGTFASHGCVGLTDAGVKDFSFELARLSGTDLTLEDVNNFGKNKTETKNVKLARPIPVELRYETIVVENGALKIYRDVYERGTNTEENLRRVLEAYSVSLDNLAPADRDKILAGLRQMASDAQGNPVDQANADAAAANANSANAGNKNAGNKNANANGSVTKTIKGQKEVSFPLAELAGKGYPAPTASNFGF